jgi:hypothetical protein
MPDVKGTALLPKGEANGLLAIADELVKDPNRPRAAIIILDAKRGTEDYDQHDTTVTVRVRRVELLLAKDLEQAELMLRRAMGARNGQEPLEFDLEDEIERTFKDMLDQTSTEDPEEPGKGGQDGEPGK